MAKTTKRAAWVVAFALAAVGSVATGQTSVSVGSEAAPCLKLRVAPDTAAAVLGCEPPGTAVTSLGEKDGWTRVELADGRQGWMFTRYLTSERSSRIPAPVLEAAVDGAKPTVLGMTLYDQTDSPLGAGFISQLFEPANAGFDCRAADDFTVPAPDIQWDVAEVRVLGGYIQGPGTAPLLDLEFFPDAGGLPAGAATCSYPGLVAGVDFVDDGTGNFDVTLPAICSLPAGDYWLSVRADMDLGTGGQWLWAERSVQSGAQFAWENPPDGFGTGCVVWTAANGCGASGPDLLFALEGIMVPVELQSISID